jgi:hypothetical protein
MKNLIIVVFFFIAAIGHAQKIPEFGKVSKELLAATSYAKDSSASAHIVFKKITYSAGYYIDVHERIKIYNKDGFDWADFVLTFPDISKIQANTYNLEDDKIVISKASKKDIFEEEITKNIKIKKIPLPDVKEGSVIEIKYRSGYGGLIDFYVQDFIPLENLNVKVEVPGMIKLKIEQNQRANVKLNTVRSGGDYLFKAKDIPAVEREDFVDNINNFRGKLIFNLLSITPPQGGHITYEGWNNILAFLYRADYDTQLKEKYSFYDKTIDSIVEGVKGNSERTKHIYNYVKENIKWNEYYGYLSNKGIKKAFKSGEGNVADINLLLVKMLRKTGIKANPVLVSTRDQAIKLFPSLDDFNYLVCGVEVANDVLLLDASNKFLKYGELTPEVLGTKGRLVRDDRSHNSVNLLPSKISTEHIIVTASLDEDFVISGKTMRRLTQYNAFNYREAVKDFENDDYLEELKKEYKDVDITDLDIRNKDEVKKPITEIFNFEYEEAIEEAGENIFLTPLLFLTATENPFKAEKRTYPIDFNFPIMDKFMLTIKIPESMEIVTLPENANISLENKLADFKYRISATRNVIQILYEFQINSGIIPTRYYPEIKELFKLVVDKNAQKVVLKQK